MPLSLDYLIFFRPELKSQIINLTVITKVKTVIIYENHIALTAYFIIIFKNYHPSQSIIGA